MRVLGSQWSLPAVQGHIISARSSRFHPTAFIVYLVFARDLKLLMTKDEKFRGGQSERMYDLSEYFTVRQSYDTAVLCLKCFDQGWSTV